MRMHVVLPEELVQEIDKRVGKGRRSQFIEEAVREKLCSETLLSALEETAGILSAEGHPEWATGEGVAQWVRDAREQADQRLQDLRRG